MINDEMFAFRYFLLNWLSFQWYYTPFLLQWNILICVDKFAMNSCNIPVYDLVQHDWWGYLWCQSYLRHYIHCLMLAIWQIEVYGLLTGQEIPCFSLLCSQYLSLNCFFCHFNPIHILTCNFCMIYPFILPAMSMRFFQLKCYSWFSFSFII